MSRRQLATGLVLAVLALVVGTLWVRSARVDDHLAYRGAEPVWDVMRADVTGVRLTRGTDVRVLKAGEGDEIAEIVDAVEEARFGTPLDTVDGGAFGLEPGVRLDVYTKDQRAITAWVGDLAPGEQQTYLRGPDGKVYAVYGGLFEAVNDEAVWRAGAGGALGGE